MYSPSHSTHTNEQELIELSSDESYFADMPDSLGNHLIVMICNISSFLYNNNNYFYYLEIDDIENKDPDIRVEEHVCFVEEERVHLPNKSTQAILEKTHGKSYLTYLLPYGCTVFLRPQLEVRSSAMLS